MGGKTWSREEELIYWKELIPHSPKRLGKDIGLNKEREWTWVAKQMKLRAGEDARRGYTHLCVFEHYFQNCNLSNFSPNVGKLHKKYWKHEQALIAARAEARAAASDGNEVPTVENETVCENAQVPKAEDDTGCEDAPIDIDCQYSYSTLRPCYAQPPSTHFTIPLTAPHFVPRDSMPPQRYPDRYTIMANRDCPESAEAVEDGLFVAQPVVPWMDPVVPQNCNYYQ